jgi:antitoxin PrlF
MTMKTHKIAFAMHSITNLGMLEKDKVFFALYKIKITYSLIVVFAIFFHLLYGNVVITYNILYIGKESKEILMELAKVTSKGQITIPVQIRKKLKLKEGDKVFFIEEKGKVLIQNASQVALRSFQEEMTGEASRVGFLSEEDVISYIQNFRKNNGK